MVTSNQPLTPDPWPGTQPSNIRRDGLGVVPSAPASASAAIVDATHVAVSWTPSDTGRAPDQYLITSTPPSIPLSVPGSVRSVSVPFAFVSATAYQFHVAAVAWAGASSAADAAPVTPNP